MICSRIVDNGHMVDKKNKYLVDTNILLYLYGDPGLSTETVKLKMLSRKFNSALDMNCVVYVPAIVIGEFINRYHKLEFGKIRKKDPRKSDYKRDYRNTQKYVENNRYIIQDVIQKIILDRCKVIGDDFEKSNLEKIFSVDEKQEFNDNLIIDIANRNGLYLISADIDAEKITIK